MMNQQSVTVFPYNSEAFLILGIGYFNNLKQTINF
jgi:hypothetical protein